MAESSLLVLYKHGFFEVITFSTSPLAPLLIKERGKFILKVLPLIRRGFR
jgi:hypothetical protein